ncbi:hypothetical protein PsAD46_02635 [Pseudovibrio sp. Ad46]|nr:hypothetical protein PsAD46_02635 [Pseudovibrio sp. Ad46]
MPGSKTAGMNNTNSARCGFCHHGEAVIGIQFVLSNLIARCFVKGLQVAGDRLVRRANRKPGKVENVNADVPQNAQ